MSSLYLDKKKTGVLSLSVFDCACECVRNILEAFVHSVKDRRIDIADDS